MLEWQRGVGFEAYFSSISTFQPTEITSKWKSNMKAFGGLLIKPLAWSSGLKWNIGFDITLLLETYTKIAKCIMLSIAMHVHWGFNY